MGSNDQPAISVVGETSEIALNDAGNSPLQVSIGWKTESMGCPTAQKADKSSARADHQFVPPGGHTLAGP